MRSNQCRDIVTSTEVSKTEKFNVATLATTLEQCRDIKFQSCNIKARLEERRHQKQCHEISGDIDIGHQNIRSNNVVTSDNQPRH